MTVSRIRGHFGEVAILVCCILSEFFFSPCLYAVNSTVKLRRIFKISVCPDALVFLAISYIYT